MRGIHPVHPNCIGIGCDYMDTGGEPSDGPVEEPRHAHWWDADKSPCPYCNVERVRAGYDRLMHAVRALDPSVDSTEEAETAIRRAAHPATPDGHDLTRAWREGYAEGYSAGIREKRAPATEGLDAAIRRCQRCGSWLGTIAANRHECHKDDPILEAILTGFAARSTPEQKR